MSEFVFTDGQQSEGRRQGCLHLGTQLTIAEAADLREALMKALQACEELVLDATAVTCIDVTGLQSLCAVHRTGVANQCEVRLQGLDNSVWREVLPLAGFHRHEACPLSSDRQNCLWV